MAPLRIRVPLAAAELHGTQKPALETMQTRDELYDHLGYHQFEDKLDQLFGHRSE